MIASQPSNALADSVDPPRIPCFCYGSNSVAQLRERCKNDTLAAEAASLPGYRRFFAGTSKNWDGGGVASVMRIDPAASACCLGTIVWLSECELGFLDRFEGIPAASDPFDADPPNRYRREWVEVELGTGGRGTARAVAYVRNDTKWDTHPSDKYLAACARNLAPFWPLLDGKGAISVRDSDDVERGLWQPPLSPLALAPGEDPKPSREPLSRGDATYLTRLARKGCYKAGAGTGKASKSAGKKAPSRAQQPPRKPVYCSLSINEVSRISAVHESYFARVRVYLMWEPNEAEAPELLANLSERARAKGDQCKLEDDEVDALLLKVKLPKVEFYNKLEEVVLDPPAVRVYAKEGEPTALMWNAAYGVTLKEVFEMEDFPVDVQDLTLDLRLVDSTLWKRFQLVVHGVQFEAGALEITEWALCEPIVEKVNKEQTKVRLQVKRKFYFFMVNVVSVLVGVTLLSGLSFTCGVDDNGDRLSIVLTLLLTSVAFKFVVAELMPKVSYLTRLDTLVLGSMAALFSNSILVVIPSGVLWLYPDTPAYAETTNICLGVSFVAISLVSAGCWLAHVRNAGKNARTRLIETQKGKRWYHFAYYEPAFCCREDEL